MSTHALRHPPSSPRVQRLLAPALLALLTSPAGRALPAELELVRNGEPKATIVVQDNPDKIALIKAMSLLDDSKTVMFAAEQLQHYLEKVTGARLPVLKESRVSADQTLILVGRGRLAREGGVTPDGLESEGFLIRTDAGSAAILGEIAADGQWQGGLDRGTLWASTSSSNASPGSGGTSPVSFGPISPRENRSESPR